MALLTKKKRKIGLDFAAALAAMAPHSPEDLIKKEIYKVVYRLQKSFGMTREEKRQEIRQAIGFGASTVHDLEVETGLKSQDISEIIIELAKEGMIFQQKISVTVDGRPLHCYFPVE